MKKKKKLKKLIPNKRLPDRYGVARETVWRWKRDPRLNFPKPAAIINGIEYFDDAELDEYDQATLARHNAERCNPDTA